MSRTVQDFEQSRHARRARAANAEKPVSILASSLKGGNRIVFDGTVFVLKAIEPTGLGELRLSLKDRATGAKSFRVVTRTRLISKIA